MESADACYSLMNMKAIALLSGGLDSCLAVRVLQEQGIEVEAVNFQTPFCQEGGTGSCGTASRVSAFLGLPLRVLHLGPEFLDTVAAPPHGRGKNMNPCVDCRILMLRRAAALMEAAGAGFVATGEVLGQRPFSQHLKAMQEIERASGLAGLVLRPLSAKLLEPTVPEKEGWVDRERLLAISGRTRKEQLALAKKYGLVNPPTPAGGCLLTDPAYSGRLRDVLEHGEKLDEHLALLIRLGRHVRLAPSALLMVGRNERENAGLESLRGGDEWLLRPLDCAGPSAVGRGGFDGELLERAAALVARYSDRPADGAVEVEAIRAGEKRVISARAAEAEKVVL